MLLLLALLAELLPNRPGKPLAEVATESAITMKARSNMLGFGLVGLGFIPSLGLSRSLCPLPTVPLFTLGI